MANKHLLFEEWLLSTSSLTPEEHETLQEHLKSCECLQPAFRGLAGGGIPA